MATKLRNGFQINLEMKHPNEESVAEFLKATESAMGKKDLSRPLRVLEKNWVDTVGDLRLLVQERMLRPIGLPVFLCSWIEKELGAISKIKDLPARIEASQVAIEVLETDDAAPEDLNDMRVFQYSGVDFDQEGFLYWLGTNGLTEPWQNPHDAGKVMVTTSGMLENSAPASAMVGRATVRCVTKFHERAWVQFDIKDKWLKPSAYSLKHYDSWDTECLRDWDFQGSNDGVKWITLVEHHNDATINKKGGTHTWTVPEQGKYFRIFRCVMTGPNSNKHWYMACSGFEIYGTLTTAAPPDSVPFSMDALSNAVASMAISGSKEENVFSYDPSRPNHGVLYNLATNHGAQPWMNPADSGIVKVRMSSIMHDSVTSSAVVGLATVRCVTQSEANSYFSVDLLECTVRATHYMLRHYSSWDTEALRDWTFDASQNGIRWTTLKAHVSDESLQRKGQEVVWQLTSPESNEPYRFFRVQMTGPNSNGHQYLAISGFELFGALFLKDKVTPYVFDIPKVNNQIKMFPYNGKDFANDGIIAYLGTNRDTEPWQNPDAVRGLLLVTASSLSTDSQPASAIVGNQVVRCVTLAERNSWFTIDLKGLKVAPTHYSLRHYSTWDMEALRDWLFQASVDGMTWTTLMTHVKDERLNGKGGTATWALPASPEPFTFFRITQTGLNSNGHHYLALSGFELYGALHDSGTSSRSLTVTGGQSPALTPRPRGVGAVPEQNLTWERDLHGPFMVASGAVLTNLGSDNKWQMGVSSTLLVRGVHRVALGIVKDPPTTNTWKYIVGVVPADFDARGPTQWVGAKNSFGWIGGLGGKCHTRALSMPYSDEAKTGFGLGDVVGLQVDLDRGELEFFRNGVSMGVAFNTLRGPVRVACSLTGTNAAVQFMPWTDAAGMWDSSYKSQFMKLIDPYTVTNTGSENKWQSIRALKPFDSGVVQFAIEILNNPNSPNSWRIIVGCVNDSFTCSGSKQWVGASGSWGYIAGTGGSCSNLPVSVKYGKPWCQSTADLDTVGVRLDFAAHTIEFFVNGEPQGIAFNNLLGPVYPAVSLTGDLSRARLKLGTLK
eukprot:gb/GEZN01000814.1/.p1 GENE.gb/GEZN01000814.1/~~gb/GEZN01000814.1/.p1  ORF type:complete len:1063 (-),score=123.04 gb/GEZN01000814.1/:329-3517(-)